MGLRSLRAVRLTSDTRCCSKCAVVNTLKFARTATHGLLFDRSDAYQKSSSEPGAQSGRKPPLATTSGTAKL
jgi:hypothetical protein